MLYAVVQTHRKGVRLSRQEILAAEPLIGNLLLSDWLQGSAENRAIRVATLKHPTLSYFQSLMQPLFDPVLVRMTNTGFLLVGNESRLENGEVVQSVQGWWVTFRPDATS